MYPTVLFTFGILCLGLSIYVFLKGHPFTILGSLILNCALICFTLSNIGPFAYTTVYSSFFVTLGLLSFFRNLQTNSIDNTDKKIFLICIIELVFVLVTTWNPQILPNAFYTNSLVTELMRIITNGYYDQQSTPFYGYTLGLITLLFYLQILIFPFICFRIWKVVQKAKTIHFEYFTKDSFAFYQWTDRFLILFFTSFFLGSTLMLVRIFFLPSNLVVTLAFLFIGIMGVSYGIFSFYAPSSLRKEQDYAGLIAFKSSNKDSEANKYQYESKHKIQILTLLKEDKIFEDPNLTMSVMADKIGIGTRQLSRVTSEGFEMSFSDLINSYRVEQVKQNISDSSFDHYTLLAIGFEAGFSSKSNFFTVFKKFTGLTPHAYKKSLQVQ